MTTTEPTDEAGDAAAHHDDAADAHHDDHGEVTPPTRPPPRMGPGGGAGVPGERPRDLRGATGRLLGLMRGERPVLALAIGLALLGVAGQLAGPKLLGRGTDIIVRGVLGGDGIDFPSLHRLLLLLVAMYLASAVCSWAQSYLIAGVVQRTMRGLRADVEDKLNRLPLDHVDRQPRGDLLSRVTNDIDNVAQSLQQTLSQMFSSILQLFGVLALMLWISPVLALIAFVTVPLSLTITKTIAKRSKARFVEQWSHTGRLNAQVEEAFTGHAIVKAFGRQAEVEERFRITNEQMYRASRRAQFTSGSIQPAMMALGNLNFVAIAVVGGLRIASGAMSLGDVQAFIQYSRQFTMPLTQMASMFNVFQSGLASAERVFALLDGPDQTPDPEPEPAPPPRGRVEFDHVSFSYDPDRPLITDLSLVAEPGQTVAIVGPTGAGKTTLVNLLMRFYEIDAGTIRVDGRDISSMPRAELRSQMGMVLQDTWLFGGTIRENIAYGNPAATEDEILTAARATYVDRFVHSLPDGYDTVLDDEGSSVSAGEKQLLTIARAFLADPTILILDEATSSVDTRTEVLIQHAMAALRSQRTSFVIAHRLSTIRDADTILVMEAGSIVEQGHHADLLARDGAYAALYNAQFAAAAVDLDEP
ncbi:MAG: ABC transporter ATP-binding protein [Acidimicrobiales bacterium]|nr:ABC transporter ATP-binding protein [Acidimicrobiales bacterium]